MKSDLNRRITRVFLGLVGALALAATFATPIVSASSGGQGSNQSAPPKKNPLLKLAQPWPTAEELRQRKTDAEARPLFASHDPIAFTLAADFKSINKEHDPNSAKRFAAELRFARDDGRIDAIPVKLSARGHVRRMARTCDYVPLRVEFPKEHLENTLFSGQNALKLVVQCDGGGEYEQYMLREYLAYRIYNLLTPRSLRARLAKVTYVDSATDKTIGARFAMFLEDDSDLARRMEGRTVELERVVFKDVDPETLDTMMVFQYMIGNTDFSIYKLHNLILVQTPDRMLYTVAYDFDISGLVHPPYAIPMRGLPIKSVQERLYRSWCRTPAQIDPILANFVAKREKALALLDEIPGVDRTSKQETKTFLDSFYSTITNQKDVKRLFVDGSCSKAPTM